MPETTQRLQTQSERPSTFGVVPATPPKAENQRMPVATEDANTPGFRFTMIAWFAGFLFLWAMLIWDLVYALMKL